MNVLKLAQDEDRDMIPDSLLGVDGLGPPRGEKD